MAYLFPHQRGNLLLMKREKNRCSDRGAGSETSSPLRKLCQTGQPTNRPTNRPTNQTNRGTRGKKIANKIFIISSYFLHGLIDISKTRHFRRNNYHQVMFDIIVEVVFDTVVTTFQLSFVNAGLTRSIHLCIYYRVSR